MATERRALSVFDPRVPISRTGVLFRDTDRTVYAVATATDNASFAGTAPDARGTSPGGYVYSSSQVNGLGFNRSMELEPPGTILKPGSGSLSWVSFAALDASSAPRVRSVRIEFGEDAGTAFEDGVVFCLEDSAGDRASFGLGRDNSNPYVISVPTDTGSQAAWDLITDAWKNDRTLDVAIVASSAAGFDSSAQTLDGTVEFLDEPGFVTWLLDAPGLGKYWVGQGSLSYSGDVYSGGVLAAASSESDDRATFSLALGDEDERLKWIGADHGAKLATLTQLWREDLESSWTEVRVVSGYLSDPSYDDGSLLVNVEGALQDTDKGRVLYWDNNTQRRFYPGDRGMEYVAALESEGLPTGWPP